ncbi:hypothetical protein [Mesorhizobium ventifaucium]|uniref:WD40 repeat domain-containing protein n=1 Tax=Mesorhizobium ventifaucium TaxID=666020 RepID=A0ABN8JB87_9HYPH|nr:hypothetical protein [Mesorhizobium ventifaucium]CAH2395355.1 hypothetical protein MES4922_120114 [Mesorhizobium ventifaucium]
MIEGELTIGGFSCNCNAVQALSDGRLLVLLVCGDQESYVSQIASVSPELLTITPLFTADTWLLAMHFDEARGKLFCSTAGGRILEIADQSYSIVAEDLPYVSGFRSLSSSRLLAFGWHGLVMEFTTGWRRLVTGEKRRIFDLKEHDGEIFVCGDAGLFGRFADGGVTNLHLQTNTRLRRLCAQEKSMLVFSESPVMFRVADGEVESIDLPVAPAWDAVIHRDTLLVGFGYQGLYRFLDPEVEEVSARRAFHVTPWGDRLAVLADSSLWTLHDGTEQERMLQAEFQDMLQRYGLS